MSEKTEIEKTQPTRETPQMRLKNMIESPKMQQSIRQVLPRHMTAERVTKIILSCTARRSKLLECSMTSITSAIMQASELGLELGGMLGEAHLVPYKGEAQMIVGYQGLLKLARNSGQVVNIASHAVYKGDVFEADIANGEVIHKMSLDSERSDENIVAFYCNVTLTGGGRHLEVMTKRDVDKIRGRSRASSDGPWVTDYAEMGRKTVTRRACKWIPRSAELQRAIELDGDVIDTTADEVISLKDRIKARATSLSEAAPTPELDAAEDTNETPGSSA